ncbi:MAG: hypothetical protein JW909_03505 [Planctomycetes bacterium]|nr:hypothetical protein [Planctomycetota bacterium]
MPALIVRGGADRDALAERFGACAPAEGERYDAALFVLGEGAEPEDAVSGLKEALRVLRRKPAGRLLVVVAPEVIVDTALAAFAAAKSLARETALAANCVNSLWLKSGQLPGRRKPVDLWEDAATLVPALLKLDSTTGQVFVAGASATGVPI